MHDSIDFPTGKCAVNRIFRYICSYSPERFCRPETTIHNDYENRISIFIIPVAFRNRLYVKHPPDRQGATLRLDPAAALARRADRRRRLQSRRIGSGRRQSRKFRTDTAPVRCAEPVETGLQRRAYRLRTKSVTRAGASGCSKGVAHTDIHTNRPEKHARPKGTHTASTLTSGPRRAH